MRKQAQRLLNLLLITAFMLPLGVFAQKGGALPKINNKTYKLKNGLTVVLHEDKSTPIVAVNVFYHVGSKNEAPGRTGFAHLFEHMMFQGSKNYSSDYLSAVDDMGGSVNGTTNEDRTWYFETVPSNFLERALFLEADRMGNLLDAMTQEKLDNQRDVVKNERRLRVDNQPYGTMSERIGEIMYPEGHPYHWSVIGSMADLSAASLDDVKSFFRQYYVPNNAVLVLSGDFQEKQATAWIEKYFGPIAGGADVKRPNNPMPKLAGEVRKTYEDAVPFPRLSMVWHSGRPIRPMRPRSTRSRRSSRRAAARVSRATSISARNSSARSSPRTARTRSAASSRSRPSRVRAVARRDREGDQRRARQDQDDAADRRRDRARPQRTRIAVHLRSRIGPR